MEGSSFNGVLKAHPYLTVRPGLHLRLGFIQSLAFISAVWAEPQLVFKTRLMLKDLWYPIGPSFKFSVFCFIFHKHLLLDDSVNSR